MSKSEAADAAATVEQLEQLQESTPTPTEALALFRERPGLSAVVTTEGPLTRAECNHLI